MTPRKQALTLTNILTLNTDELKEEVELEIALEEEFPKRLEDIQEVDEDSSRPESRGGDL